MEETAKILRHFGFEFDQRGLVSVKGKGKLMTYYLTGRSRKNAAVAAAAAASPLGSSGSGNGSAGISSTFAGLNNGSGGGGGGGNAANSRPSPTGSNSNHNCASGGTQTKSASPAAGLVQGPAATAISAQANCVTAAPDSAGSLRKSYIQDLRGTNKQSTSISIV